MAQAQIDSLDFTFKTETFESVHCQLKYNKTTCTSKESVSLSITKQNSKSVIVLESGKNQIKLHKDIFDKLCNSKVSVDFLSGYLD